MPRPPRLPLFPSSVRWLAAGAVAVLVFTWSLLATPPETLDRIVVRLIDALALAEPVTTASPRLRGAVTVENPPISRSSLSSSPLLPDSSVLTVIERSASLPDDAASVANGAVDSDAKRTTTASSAGTSPTAPEIPNSFVRHVFAYATLSLSLAYALVDRSTSVRRKAIVVFVAATGYGALIEVGQLFHPERVGSTADLAANALGTIAGLGWYLLEEHVRFVRVPDR